MSFVVTNMKENYNNRGKNITNVKALKNKLFAMCNKNDVQELFKCYKELYFYQHSSLWTEMRDIKSFFCYEIWGIISSQRFEEKFTGKTLYSVMFENRKSRILYGFLVQSEDKNIHFSSWDDICYYGKFDIVCPVYK